MTLQNWAYGTFIASFNFTFMHFHLQAVADKATHTATSGDHLSIATHTATSGDQTQSGTHCGPQSNSCYNGHTGEPTSHYSAPGKQLIIPHCHKSQLLHRTVQSLLT